MAYMIWVYMPSDSNSTMEYDYVFSCVKVCEKKHDVDIYRPNFLIERVSLSGSSHEALIFLACHKGSSEFRAFIFLAFHS